MTEHTFDKDYWEQHWEQRDRRHGAVAANPYLAVEVGDLAPGVALDAGCGDGAEAIWLAEAGWQVVAADISAAALGRAAERASESVAADRVEWVEADLSVWHPDRRFDLVMTHYAHPAMPQLAFYQRIADWVAPAGTLLIVGHLHHSHHTHDHDHDHNHGSHQAGSDQPPEEATATAAAITALFDPTGWQIVTAAETSRTVAKGSGETVVLADVVVRATRRS